MNIPKSVVKEAWNQIEEVNADFDQLTDDELINCKQVIKNRLATALSLLGAYVDDQQG